MTSDVASRATAPVLEATRDGVDILVVANGAAITSSPSNLPRKPLTSAFPPEYYAALERRLTALLPLVMTTIPAELAKWFREYVLVGEYGLAVEVVAEQLEAGMPPPAAELASGLLPEAELMSLPEEIIELLRTVARADG